MNRHPNQLIPITKDGQYQAANIAPLETQKGFHIRPGFFGQPGVTLLPQGVCFTVQSSGARLVSLALFRRGQDQPYVVLNYGSLYRVGDVYSMIVFFLDIREFEYAFYVDGEYDPKRGLLFDDTIPLLDPYCTAVTGQGEWGKPRKGDYHSAVMSAPFHWGMNRRPNRRLEDMIIYEMHVRGFTIDPSSEVNNPGTYEGIREKIPYLIELGVNAIELMPIFEFDELASAREYNGETLLDYWGYNPLSFFAPNASYASGVDGTAGTELKRLIRDLHDVGIEVILDVVFNHTVEGDERGPVISFKGLDNNIYYLINEDGKYYNFSGCGNTINANHPIVSDFILDCLRYWVIEYHIDGFRFDLASILGRDENGNPIGNPPILKRMAFDPILSETKLIAEAWDAGGLYQVGTFPNWNRWSEWNGRYRDDMRRFLKGDPDLVWTAAHRIAGSHDIYDPRYRNGDASVNFITCHDGFTMHDLYAYNSKHNEANGWGSTDGTNENYSWNCGVEGETKNLRIVALRRKMVRNAFAVLMFSHGTPMFLAGDEFGNTQYGNNNPYCQDNEISWLDWEDLEKNKGLFEYVKELIRLRKAHPCFRDGAKPTKLGLPLVSYHGEEAWSLTHDPEARSLGMLFAARDAADFKDEVFYLAINAHWEDRTHVLPEIADGARWRVRVNTNDESKPVGQALHARLSYADLTHRITIRSRSVILLQAIL